ncbi:MAG: FAD-dependent oxidoreductase [Planctomycetes bacterium]|nr:FAD-dependent oxidoreductase [Planctomycetota bacterium]
MGTESTTSLWTNEFVPQLAPLDRNESADVCVIGAGISGLTTAYLLTANGQRVIVLDADAIGGGETSRTTAHLSNVSDDRFQTLERIHGEKGSRLFAESHAAAIDRIESIVQEERIDCDFQRVDGYLFQPEAEPLTAFLEAELEAAKRAGHIDASFLQSPSDVGFAIGSCVRFPNQAQFHPLKYLSGLVRALRVLGASVHAHSRVQHVQGGENAYVQTKAGYRVTCKHIVVATNAPFNNRYVLHTKQASYRSYAIALKIPAGRIKGALYWDTLDPYHYVRLQRLEKDKGYEEFLIVGGEDHRTGQEKDPADRFERLEAWARQRFPMAEGVANRWSGQIVEPVDGVAFIGRNPMDDDNVFVATGDSGMGMTHGTIAGMLLTDLIEGRENPWTDLYDPARKSLRSLVEFTKENLNSAVQYFDWVTAGDVDALEKIEPGRGAVVRSGLHKLAIYRDPEGGYHQCSAVCPHLGGIVAWNEVENSWDCPCHGSRFAADGTVINGPAATDLPKTAERELLQEAQVAT